jgi:Zn-dependent peptidase ImmA (M78 family)/DNA-binding XRE family transcriptional regulator
MITLAREARGYTQAELSQKLDISQGKLSKLEKGLLGGSDETLKRLINILDYPESFFYEPETIYPAATPFHRKKKSLSKRIQCSLEAKANVCRIHVMKLLEALEIDEDLVYLDLDDYNESPEEVAAAIRRYWSIPKGPIENITELLENAGIVVFHFDFGVDEVDGFTLLSPKSPPIIFLNKNLLGDRLRFTLAHELGHIVMHKIPTLQMEKEADKFASEFLMPSEEIKQDLKNVDLPKLASLKPYWKVSMASLLKKASDIGTITENQTRNLWIKMSNYRRREPPAIDITKEEPSLLEELIDYHIKKLKFSDIEMSNFLNLRPQEFSFLYGKSCGLKIIK